MDQLLMRYPWNNLSNPLKTIQQTFVGTVKIVALLDCNNYRNY